MSALPPTTARYDLVALGEGMLEFNQTRPGQPEYIQGFGGDTSNAVIAAARAGARCAYLSRVGGDGFGRALLELWRREGVATGAVEVDPDAPTGLYFVTHGEAGHEFSYRRAGSAAARMTPQWLAGAPADAIRASKILHVSGISLAISAQARDTVLAAMQLARDSGVRVSFDANLRLKLWSLAEAREGIAAALALTDIFLPSLDDVVALNGLHDPAEGLAGGHGAGAGTVVLKRGSEGAVASDGRRQQTIPGLAARTVDATGAGDCFAGNLLARLAAGDDVFTAARYANAAASLAVRGYGAVAPLPTAAQVRAVLA